MKRNFLFVGLLICLSNFSFGQQLPLMDQYLVNRFALSPSYAGMHDFCEAFVGYRKQWVGVDGSPVSKLITMDAPILGNKMALGGTIISDQTDIFTHFYGALSYAYHLKLAENHYLHFGLSGVVYENSIDLTKIKVETLNDPIIAAKETFAETVFNAGASLMYSFKGLNIGFHAPIIFNDKSNYDKDNNINEYMLTRQYVAHASYDIDVKNTWQIQPGIIMRKTDFSPYNFEFSSLFKYNNQYWLGALVRNTGDVGICAGIKLGNQFIFNYTYEFLGNGILGKSSGTHDFTIGAYFGQKIKKITENQIKLNIKTDSLYTANDRTNQEIKEIKENRQKVDTVMKNQDKRADVLQERLNDVELELGNLKNNYKTEIEQIKRQQELQKEIKNIETEVNDMGGQFFVIIESFKFKENALKSLDLWKVKGIDAKAIFNGIRGFYYVYAGKFSTYKEAQNLKQTLAEKSIKSWIYLWVEKKK